MRGFLADFRYGARCLRRTPGMTLAAVVTLALGIGVTAALGSAVYAAAWRPLPYPNGTRLVQIFGTNPQHTFKAYLAPGEFHDWTGDSRTLTATAMFWVGPHTQTAPGAPRETSSLEGTPALFGTLQMQPRLGRAMTAGDTRPGAAPVAWISSGYWAKAFGSSREVLRQTVMLDGERTAIAGVLPPGFGALAGAGELDFVTPLTLTPQQWASREGGMYSAVARLAPGMTMAAAEAELDARAARTAKLGHNFPDVVLVPLHQQVAGDLGNVPWMLVAVAGLILLLTCANVAGLLVARAAGKQREMAVRMALGAGRGRLVRAMFAEGVLLGALGGAAGAWMAWAMLEGVAWLHPPYWLREAQVGGGTLLIACIAASMVAAVLCSVLPAVWASRRALAAGLPAGGPATGAHSGQVRGKLVAGELALALVLAISAGVLIRTVGAILAVPLGFNPNHVLETAFSLAADHSPKTLAASMAFYQTVLASVQALPGVKSAALTNVLPFTGDLNMLAQQAGQEGSIHGAMVSPDYFTTLGIPVLQGRSLLASDRAGSTPVALVSQRLAEQWWPGQDAIGKQLRLKGPLTPTPLTVVGVVGDIHQFDRTTPIEPEAYLPLAQVPLQQLTLAVRTSGDPAAMIRPVQDAAAQVNTMAPLVEPEAMTAMIANDLGHQRFLWKLFTLAAILALLLAAVGVYGAVGTWVEERTREVGVRMALGADPGSVLRLVLGCALRWAVMGAVIGAGGAWLATRTLRSDLFGVTPTDPATFAGAAALLVTIALAAAWLPARRAAASDPAQALRRE